MTNDGMRGVRKLPLLVPCWLPSVRLSECGQFKRNLIENSQDFSLSELQGPAPHTSRRWTGVPFTSGWSR